MDLLSIYIIQYLLSIIFVIKWIVFSFAEGGFGGGHGGGHGHSAPQQVIN